MRTLTRALCWGLVALCLNAQTATPQDEFHSSRPGPGRTPERSLNEYPRDAECGGTDRSYYDEMFGSTGRVVSLQEAQRVYRETKGAGWHRCGSCGPNKSICWPNNEYFASNGPPGDRFNSNNPPQSGPASPDLSCRGTYTQCFGHKNAPPRAPTEPVRNPMADPRRQRAVCERPRRLVCDLRQLASEVSKRYDRNSRQPIGLTAATRMRRTAEGLVSLPTGRRLYLVTLSGVELHQNGQPTPYFDDAVREWMQLRSRYRRSVIDIIRQYGADDDTQYFVAGHSLGGAVGLGVSADAAMTSSGRPIDRVVTFGSPVLDTRYGPATHWVRVEADGDPALSASRTVRGGKLVPIPGHDWSKFEFNSHAVYEDSSRLAEVDLRGFERSEQIDGADCLCLDERTASFDIFDTGPVSSDEKCGPLPPVANPRATRVQFSAQQISRWQTQWKGGELRSVSEEIGEAAMDSIARDRGYEPLIASTAASSRPQGYDGVYFDPATREIVIGEAKGGYNGSQLDDILGCAYGFRQGTLEWAGEAAKRIIADRRRPASDPQELAKRELEVRRAGQVMAAMRGQLPGGVRIEVFHTEHNQGIPGVTRHYVVGRMRTASP